jgi:hypothetical protein
MTRNDPDQSLIKLLWFVKGGRLRVGRDGTEAFYLTHNGVDPEIDIRDLDALKSLLPTVNPSFMERMRKLSKRMAASNRNVRITVNGRLFLNLGSRGTVVKDIGGFARIVLHRAKELRKNR